MAWNEPGSGNNDKKDDKDPWTGRPRQSAPPDLEAALRRLRQQFTKLFANKLPKTPFGKNANGGNTTPIKFNKMGIAVAGAVLLIAWILWGIFIVGPAEQAVILRFGKYVETVGPGPHWMPRLIEDAYLVNEQTISNYSYNAEMLTKDENIVSVAVAVQYRINDARAYLFNVINPQESLKQATASALRQVIGHTNLTDVLTSGREQIRQEVATQLTKILARYNTGLLITDVAMQPAKAPEEVKEAFDDAIKAQEDEQRYENQAQAYAMQVEPIAKGQAQRLLADARGYQQQVVLRAKADIAPFLALLPQYEKAPAVTRERLYLETIESVLTNSNKVLVDTPNCNNMFYLPLDKLIAPPPIVKTKDSAAVISSELPAAASVPLRSTSSSSNRAGGYE
jgi:membrane protease subunit HflK